MKQKIKRMSIVVIGVLFVLLGLIGLVLPFLQGFLFIIIGLILLSISSPSIGKWMERHTRKYPKIHSAIQRTENWVRGQVGPLD